MFRLIKLAAYALLGYAIYEFCRGFTAELPAKSRQGGSQSGSSSQPSRKSSSGPAASITGGGEGMAVRTQAGDGGAARHVVGRGVVSR